MKKNVESFAAPREARRENNSSKSGIPVRDVPLPDLYTFLQAPRKLTAALLNWCGVIIILVLLVQITQARELTVEKIVSEQNLKAGDSATIMLHFVNPFDKEVPVKIVDKNVIANNGMDIQCMEFTIPNKTDVAATYSPIQLFQEGDFTLGSANITYTNPDTGKEDVLISAPITVHVDKGTTSGGGQGITTIYQCNGQNMQSTSYSSSGQNMQVSVNNQLQQQIQQQMNQEQQQMQQSAQQQQRNAVQNNQMDQDANAMKQQMEKSMQQQEKMKQDFANQVAQNPDFQKEHQKMLEQGYNVSNAEFNPETNKTGDFNVNYTRPDGETASLSGNMKDGKMTQMQKTSSEEQKAMMQNLAQNQQYQQYSQQLKSQGFNQTSAQFNTNGNKTQATLQYTDAQGNKANITADFMNQTVKKVEMQKDEDGMNAWMIPAIIAVVVILGVLGYFIYKKYFMKQKQAEAKHAPVEKPIDYHKESRKMLDEARKLFTEGKEKDAYEKAGGTIRFFYTHHLGYRKELTNSQTIEYLKKHKIGYHQTQKCLNMCGMVEFAKYKANKKDFDEIVKAAEGIIEK